MPENVFKVTEPLVIKLLTSGQSSKWMMKKILLSTEDAKMLWATVRNIE